MEVQKSKPGEYDFIKDIPEIIRGNFPKMRRMKRRMALEVSVMIGLLFLLGWLQYGFPNHTLLIPVVLIPLIALFLTLQVFAFRAYWYTPSDIDRAIATRKIARKTGAVANLMIITNICLAIFTVILFCADVVINILNWQLVFLLLVVQAGFTLFSARWISFAKDARREANFWKRINNFQ